MQTKKMLMIWCISSILQSETKLLPKKRLVIKRVALKRVLSTNPLPFFKNKILLKFKKMKKIKRQRRQMKNRRKTAKMMRRPLQQKVELKKQKKRRTRRRSEFKVIILTLLQLIIWCIRRNRNKQSSTKCKTKSILKFASSGKIYKIILKNHW